VVALLAAIDGRPSLDLLVHQGDDMGRPSLLRARAQQDGDGVIAHVGGDCVTVMEGHFVLVGQQADATTGTTQR